MYDNRPDTPSDRQRLEAGMPAPCAICGRVIQPTRETHTVIPGETILLVQKLARLPIDVHPTPYDAVICAFCQDPTKHDPTNDFRRPDKASAYEYALKLAADLPDPILYHTIDDVQMFGYITDKIQTTYPNMLALHVGQVAAKALRVERGRRRVDAATATRHQQVAEHDALLEEVERQAYADAHQSKE